MLEATTDFVGTARPDGTIEFLNRAGRRLLGIADDADLSHLSAAAFHPPETIARLVADGFPAAARDGVWNGEGELIGAAGERIPVAITMVSHAGLDTRAPTHMTAVMRDLRERRRTEDVMTNATRELRALFSAMRDVVLVLDRDGTYLRIVSTAPDQLIRPPDDVIGRRVHDFYPVEQADAFVATIRRALDDNGPAEHHYQVPIRIGLAWFAATATPLTADTVLWVARDVTSAHRDREALCESEARFRAMFDRAASGVTVIDPRGRIIAANPAFHAFLGYDDGALVGRHAPDLSPAEDADVTRTPVAALRAGQVVSATVEKRFVRRDGELRWAQLTMTSYPLPESEVGLLGMIVDLTDRKRTEAALEASEALFRGALDASIDGFMALRSIRDASGTTVDFQVVEANARATAMLDTSRADLLSRPLGQLFPLLPPSAHFKRFLDVDRSQQAAEWEYETVEPRVTARVLQAQAVPLPDGLALSLRDVTARWQAERERQLLLDVTHALAGVGDLRTAAATALEIMSGVAGWEYGETWLVSDPTADREPRRLTHGPEWHSAGDARLAEFASASDAFSFGLGEGMPGTSWQTAAPAVCADLFAPDARFARQAEARAAGLASGVAVPVLADGDVVAVLTFYTRRNAVVDPLRVALLASVATQIGGIVRRKLMEDALARERSFLATVLDSLSENVSVCGPDGRLALFNRATLATHGLPADGSLPPDRWSEYYAIYQPDGVTPLPVDGLPHVRARANRADVSDIEFVVAVPGRAPRTMVANATVLSGSDGAFLGTVCAARDMTEQKAAEAALREHEARLRLIYDSASDLMFLMRVEHASDAPNAPVSAYRCESVNAAYYASTGLTPEQLIGRTLEEVLPPDAAAAALEKYDIAVASGDTLRYEEQVDLPTARILVETTLTPILDDAGRCTHLLGAARDVTARLRAESALRESESRFRGVLENVRAVAVTLDVRGRVTFVNDALLGATGWTRGEVMGRDWFTTFVPGGNEVRVMFDDMMQRNEIVAHYENEIVARDGARRLVAWDNTLLHDSDGRVAGTASLGRDVTEQRALEQRLAALSEHDELTGLLNRRGFRRMADQAIKIGRRGGRRDAVLYIDLDAFKAINDSYGHGEGDAALRTVARVLRAGVREGDVVSRLGGDEFAIYAAGLASEEESHAMAARLRAALDADNEAASSTGRRYRVGFTVGVSDVTPGDDLDGALARADAALYARKLARNAALTAR